MEDLTDDIVDLSPYTVEECCYWLLSILKTENYTNDPYARPYSNYVLTWPRAVPLTAIILAQSPYPNNIFTTVSAAMSYSPELCKKVMKRSMPPTVEVLANDLYINAGLDKNISISVLKDGWALVDSGILLVNECVFQKQNSAQSFKECSDQCNVIIRLLRETEKYGKRTVDIFALGESGERMGSNLCSWFRSDIVRLSKRKATHPAGIARRFDNLQDPNCTLGVPTLSKALAKHFSNYVASVHIMAKQSKLELDLKRQASAIKGVGKQFKHLEEDVSTFIQLQQKLEMTTHIDDEAYKDMLKQIVAAGNALTFRLNIAAGAALNVEQNTSGISNYVGKAGPVLNTVAPSNSLVSQHVGHESKEVSPASMKTVKIAFGKKKAVTSTATSDFTGVSSPPSVVSINSTTPSKGIKFSFNKAAKSTTSTTQESKNTSTPSEVSTLLPDDDIPTTSSLGARFKNKNLTHESNKLGNFGKAKDVKESPKSKEEKTTSRYSLTKEYCNQLSAVEAVVISSKPDVRDNEDYSSMLENIQNDISVRTIYNHPVGELVEAIKKDIAKDKDFDFSSWIFDTKKPSATYDKCKELFDL